MIDTVAHQMHERIHNPFEHSFIQLRLFTLDL
ncbi:Uncharacterised protein [Vibrio cholerae]|nr:Uncharacterised protein [Vibrio cholerae]